MDKYRNKYRIRSARAQWWDYAWDAAYFVTICTWKRKWFFGEIHNDEMVLSETGQIADSCWREIASHAKNIVLGPHVIMPNHVHGIIVLDGNQTPFVVETRPALSLQQPPKTIGQMRFGHPGKNSLSTILGGYKSAVTREAHMAGIEFQWQSRFHDHIIRSREEYERIVRYIENNPKNWKGDKFYKR